MNEPASKRASPLAPLRIATFRSLWIATISSNFGGLIQGVGAAWIMTSISQSANMVALVQASTTLPIMVFSLMSGAVADSFDRRRVMLAAQIFMLVISACLTIATGFGLITPWTLLTFTFLIGCGAAFNNPSWQATVGDIVPREDLGAAVLLNSVGFNVTRSVAPALGGAIVVVAGAAAAFAVNTLSYVGLITALVRWQPKFPAPTLPRENLATAINSGVRYVAMSPNLLKVLLRGFIFGLTTVVVLALLPLVARHLMQGDALVFGGLLGAFGLGAVGGAGLSSPARERLSNEMLARWAFIAFAVCATVTATSSSIWLTGAALMIGGAAWVIALSLFNTTVQILTPRWVVGRALSLYQMAIFGGMALGSWLWGTIAELYSLEASLLIAAAGMVLGAAVGLRVPLPRLGAMDLDPLNRWQVPQVALEIEPRSGPVSVSVEYLINETTVPDFLDAMAARHRIRRRDGARQWTLMRDMENPNLWIERFELATWVDYIRFHMRTTRADAAIGDRVRGFHQGTEPPRVRRMLIRTPIRSRIDPAARVPIDIQ